MPEIHVYAAEGRTVDQKRQLMKDITDAVVRNFGVAPDAVIVQIIEAPKTSKSRLANYSPRNLNCHESHEIRPGFPGSVAGAEYVCRLRQKSRRRLQAQPRGRMPRRFRQVHCPFARYTPRSWACR
jgi:4-oxalocrotonate tautomerase